MHDQRTVCIIPVWRVSCQLPGEVINTVQYESDRWEGFFQLFHINNVLIPEYFVIKSYDFPSQLYILTIWSEIVETDATCRDYKVIEGAACMAKQRCQM